MKFDRHYDPYFMILLLYCFMSGLIMPEIKTLNLFYAFISGICPVVALLVYIYNVLSAKAESRELLDKSEIAYDFEFKKYKDFKAGRARWLATLHQTYVDYELYVLKQASIFMLTIVTQLLIVFLMVDL